MSRNLTKPKKLQLKLHPYFLLFMLLWLLAGLPLQVFTLFLLVLGHELAHILTARFCTLPVNRIELLPFGGVGYLDKPLELEQPKEMLVAAAGPLFNFILFLFFYNWSRGMYSLPVSVDPLLLSFLTRANLFLCCFNLLPGLPLDGGRLLRASLSPRLGFYRATELVARAGRWLGVLLVAFGLLLSSFDYLNLSLSLIGLFLYAAAGREQNTTIYIFLRYLLRKEKSLHRHRVLKGELLVSLEGASVMDVLKQFKPARYHQVVVLGPTFHVKAVLSETFILAVAMQQGMDVTLGEAARQS
ncbi:MAG: M50 family metallopeptidase [Bacillota bacterium]